MQNLIQNLKETVTAAAANEDFLHHEWFVEYHLKIAEQIALELCSIYKKADVDIVTTLIWVHDYPKIIVKEREHDPALLEKVYELLLVVGFDKEFADKIIDLLTIFEHK